jgi:accessory gene regulator B
MMEKCIGRIVDWLVQRGEAEEADRELYAYALKNILNAVAPIFLALLIGIILHCAFRTIMIILPFVLLRKFSGGFHLSSAIACVIFSSLLLIACSLLSFELHVPEGILLIAAGASISLIILSPRENINKPLSDIDRKRCKCWVIGIVGVLYTLIGILYLFDKEIPFRCFSIGMALTAVLQYPCLLEKRINHRTN